MRMTLVFTKIGTLSLVFLLCLLCLESDGADIGGNCTVNGNCTYDNGTCVDSTCGCVATHYIHVDGSNKICQLKVMLNDYCSNGQPSDQCLDVQAECDDTGTLRCLCKDGYYENSGSVCTQKSAPGEKCINGQPPIQCSVITSECISAIIGSSDYRCICKASYYRDGQECKSLTGLKVQNLDVPEVTTGETFFVVTWTNPPTVNFINKYQLILMFDGKSESPVDIDNTSTNYNISNRVPGRTYTIILRSVETQTRPTPQTIDVVITDGTRPAIPGAIIQSMFNGPTISISWTITGDLVYLSGTINDTTASPSTFNLTFASHLPLPLLSVTNLRHGDHYTFTVISHSNGFSSAEYSETIRTTPTRPPPPTVFACIDNNIFDRSMILTWKEPAVPNGYIQNYIIYDMTRSKQITTNGSVLEQTIDGLTPEWYYNFSITTVNDATNGESSHSNPITCRAKEGLSTPPQNFVATAVTSNKITVQWNYPIDPAGVLWGYRIHVKTDDTCVQEIIFQCVSDCAGVKNLNHTYNCIKNITLNTDSTKMNQTMSYNIEDLLPYVNYKVTIQAVNAAGNGHPAAMTRTTFQEIPKEPLQVTGVAQPDPKTLLVTWQQPLPRPGITTYTVKVYEENDEATKFVYKEGLKKEISGYYIQTATIDGLEEYWNYKFVIVAATSIGFVESNMTTAVRTRHSAPGKVVNFTIRNPSEIYNQINVMWSIPLIRERNSVIEKYVISHNISGNMESLNVTASSDSVMKTFNVTAEQWYEVEVYAVNTQNQMGSKSNEIHYAEPGPPRPPPVDAVIESTSAPATTQTTIKLKFESSWFLNTDSGKITDGGVMVCQASKCTEYGKSSQQKFFSHFRDLRTWKKSKTGGFEKPYRVTNSFWVDDISATSGRRKRSTNEVELIIGEDVLCDKKDDTVFCNGPLPAGTSFIVVAFTCTNGGCTESQHFGPYSTQASSQAKNDTCNTVCIVVSACSSTVAIILLVVLVVTCIRYKAVQRNVNQNVNNTNKIEYNRHYCDLTNNIPNLPGQEYDMIESNYNTIDNDRSQYHNNI